jgi:ATP-dependent Lon protease
VAYTYIDWLISVPWNKYTEDTLDVKKAFEILNDDHYDLKDVKERILEFLSVLQLKKDKKSPILCFVGPPGVGKTSLGQSIAKAMGRQFIRMSLGGIKDEAEIRGHRRTYIGALPGRIIQGMKKAASSNPVFMLDEIDKVGNDFRGDPASALLEVLDPKQNSSFNDHYLELDYDLSSVMFIATANILDTIPPALLDRMEIIRIPGYTAMEKKQISNRFLIPRQIQENGLNSKKVKFKADAVDEVINYYTREAGVRTLERTIGSVLRKIARKIVEGELKIDSSISIGAKDVNTFLGPHKFLMDEASRKPEIGTATGMAWTSSGGSILTVEATMMPGKGELKLTGSLGDVMKESAHAAFSFIKSHCVNLKIDDKIFSSNDFHIHVPDGATPKDGPSAGITIASALVSLLLNRPLRMATSMTGEITLRGKVTPVGGIKEKVIAALRSGIKTIVMPAENKKDLEDIPDEVRKKIKFVFAEYASEVFDFMLAKKGKK